MPKTAEKKTESNPTSGPPATLTSWWKKFHFSGRVIMCSVLFGLGLVLIGGLIFAINMDDDESSKSKEEDISNVLPTKPPSNYVGPVVMGIGGFIVTVGVIMCLFETQVCRKKTGDSSPLISGKNDDPEATASDPTAIPSTSHSHKNHSHKNRSGYKSKKSKSRHAKVHSYEHDHENTSSSQSPPVSIEKPKSYMTSSEEKFLTPPNTLEQRNSQDAEIQTSSSLMKSFTSSSGPSWNQSTEFLTPSTSFRDTSVSLDNSVEIDEKQGQVNFKTNDSSGKEYVNPSFMTPLTVEEDRIQKLFNKVKNQQMEMAKQENAEKQSAADIHPAAKREDADSSRDELKDTTIDTEMEKDDKKIVPPSNDMSMPIILDTQSLKNESDQKAELLNKEEEKENDTNEEQLTSTTLSKTDINADDTFSKKAEEDNGQLVMNFQGSQAGSSFDVPEKKDHFLADDSAMSPLDEVKHDADLKPECETLSSNATENGKQDDLESSVSSDETIIPQDFGITEKPKSLESSKTGSAEMPKYLESSNTESAEMPKSLESSNAETPPANDYPRNESEMHPAQEPLKDSKNCSIASNSNTLIDEVKEEPKTRDLIHIENDEKNKEISS